MAGLKDLPNVWQNIKEMDLRPISEEALRQVQIALASRPGSAKAALANQMRRDPMRANVQSMTPLLLVDLITGQSLPTELASTDLLILLVDTSLEDPAMERTLARRWSDSGRKVLIILHPSLDEVSESAYLQKIEPSSPDLSLWGEWGKSRILRGSLTDTHFLIHTLTPALMELLPFQQLALARQFPLFRVPICRQVIQDACFTNTAYSFSTGLAEIVPGMGLPLSLADMFVLSKNQAFLVYRLGLALGLSTRWQDYVTEFGSVLGSGFFWRQLARQLVGLIPAWGIIPKVAVAYSGTYVVGNVVLQWYLTGRHLNPGQLRQLSGEAFNRGKIIAGRLAEKIPHPKFGRKTKKALPEPQSLELACANCGRSNAPDAHFCQYCGHKFDQ